jgi:3-methyladenine DNA glycosylase Tag
MPNWKDHKVEKPKNDNEYLERMSRVIFMAGLNWRILENKWPGIKKAFLDFNIAKVVKFQEPEIEELMMNPDVIRNLAKIRAIVGNAKEMQAIAKEFGGFEKYLASLSKQGEDEMVKALSKRFGFLGKGTTTIFLFSVGQPMPGAMKEWAARHK